MIKKMKKTKTDTHIVNKIIAYQQKLYKGNSMKLSDIRIECKHCKIYFTPSIYRAKKLMSINGVINKCRDCEDEV